MKLKAVVYSLFAPQKLIMYRTINPTSIKSQKSQEMILQLNSVSLKHTNVPLGIDKTSIMAHQWVDCDGNPIFQDYLTFQVLKMRKPHMK